MKYKLRAFFAGRNGFDSLGKTVLWISILVMLASGFIGIDWLRWALYCLSLFWMCWVYVRALSRNLEKCRCQNQRFVSWRNFQKQRFLQRRTHRFYRCPKCRQVLRVPKGKGKLSITCRSCGQKFIKKT